MPRQKANELVAELKREDVDGNSYDVLYIGGKEVIAFHLSNISDLKLLHNPQTILEAIQHALS